jgi:hypothetical protein
MICRCGHTKDVHVRERQPTIPGKKDIVYDHTVCNGMWCECKRYVEDDRETRRS